MMATAVAPRLDMRTSPPRYQTEPQTPPSANESPTSLYSHLHVRQLRAPKQPLYTPACLRPTDTSSEPKRIPDRPRGLETPPQSKENSFDSGKSQTRLNLSIPITQSPLEQGSASAIDSLVQQEDVFVFDEVTGPPTMAHWKPDASAASCSVCETPFTWYFRRHHCRRCGDVVCAAHILHIVPLDQNARLHPRGMKSKACDPCWREWRAIKSLHHSRTSSLADSQLTLQSPLPIHKVRQTSLFHMLEVWRDRKEWFGVLFDQFISSPIHKIWRQASFTCWSVARSEGMIRSSF
ncbi:hypothetical protein MRB53_040040 [Persea americana]|nr:hypothetical protein MRB53_040040 [Persea americana]